MDRNDQELKELYLLGREESRDAPDFDVLMARNSSPETHHRRWKGPLLFAAAAAILLGLSFALFAPFAEENLSSETGALAVQSSSLKSSSTTAAVNEQVSPEWEELLEFADSLWEWEPETDFLLAYEG